MDKQEPDCIDDLVEIVDVDEDKLTFSTWRKHTFATFLRHKRALIIFASVSLCVFLLATILQIPVVRNIAWSKVSGIPLDAISVRIQGREVYGLRKIDGTLLWHVTLDSVPSNSPQIVGNDVYVLCENDILYVFKAQSGSLLWRYHMGDFAAYQPLLANQMVYVSDPYGVVKAVQAGNGRMLWKTSFSGKISTPLVIAGSMLYVCIDNKIIVALRLTDGSLIWKFTASSTITSPIVVRNDVLYYSVIHDTLIALSSLKGSLLWKKQIFTLTSTTGKADFILSVKKLILYISSDINSANGNNSLIAVNATDGSQLWHRQLSQWSVRSAIISGQNLYTLTLDGSITKYDGDTGKEVWHIQLGNAYTSSMAIADNRIYIYSIDGAFDTVSAENGKLVQYGRTDLLISSPMIIHNHVYVESHDTGELRQGGKQYYSGIIDFDAATGAIMWHYFSFIPLSSPTVVDGHMYVADIQGNVAVLDARKGTLIWHK